MSATCVIGLQWGDEAKGKIVDWLTQDPDVIIRYNGGSNAGHTVVKEQKTYKFSLGLTLRLAKTYKIPLCLTLRIKKP